MDRDLTSNRSACWSYRSVGRGLAHPPRCWNQSSSGRTVARVPPVRVARIPPEQKIVVLPRQNMTVIVNNRRDDTDPLLLIVRTGGAVGTAIGARFTQPAWSVVRSVVAPRLFVVARTGFAVGIAVRTRIYRSTRLAIQSTVPPPRRRPIGISVFAVCLPPASAHLLAISFCLWC